MGSTGSGVPEIDLTDTEVLRDPLSAYEQARERSPLARILIPGLGPAWVLTRHEGARAMLGDPRFELNAHSFMRPDVPEECLAYMRAMAEMDGPEHKRLRRLVSPAFTPRLASGFRPRIEPIVEDLLDDLPGRAENGLVDLVRHFAGPLPMGVICELGRHSQARPPALAGVRRTRCRRPRPGVRRGDTGGSWRAPSRRSRLGGSSPATTCSTASSACRLRTATG